MLAKILSPIMFRSVAKFLAEAIAKSTKNKLDDKGVKVFFALLDGDWKKAGKIFVDASPEVAEWLFNLLRDRFEEPEQTK